MEIHEASKLGTQGFIEKLKEQYVPQRKIEEFQDPIREFARASKVESLVRNWLTYPIEERKRLVRTNFNFAPRQPGDEQSGRPPESDRDFEARQMERWRALCVIIQEESRAVAGNRSAEVAIAALKLLFPEHEWKVPVTPPKG
jgi:hypothetical protein